MKWYAVRTRYKCEKQVCRHLAQQGVECYLPLMSKTRRYQRKIKHYEVPLINCFIFVHIDYADRVRILRNYNVVEFLKIGNDISSVADEEIDTLRRVVGEAAEFKIGPLEWAAGDTVEVIGGSLTGLRGIMVDRSSKHEFVVELESLGYQFTIKIDESLLRRMPKRLSA